VHNQGAPTVAELLPTTGLGKARLLAGGAGLGRQVRRVQWIEVLDDFATHLAPGDLLLTTAYNLGDDPPLQHELAGRMLTAGVVAIVVKCGYYLDTIPDPVLRQADEIGLPVFELDRGVPFVEISQSIYQQLVSRSYARLQRSAGLHRELVQLVVEGADLDTVVRRAAAIIGNPVLVEDDAGRMLAGVGPDGAAVRQPMGGVTNTAGALVVPVVARGRRHGAVGLLPDRPFGADDRQALEQVATVAALEIARSDRERLAEADLAAALARDLVHGRCGDDSAAAARARRLGVELPGRACVVRVRGGGSDSLEALLDRLRGRLGSLALVARDGDELVGVVGRAQLEAVAHEVERPTTLDPDAFTAGIGEPARASALPGSHGQAGRALLLGRGLRRDRSVHRFAEVEGYDALLGDDGGERVARVYERTFGVLPDDLRHTLAVHLESGTSVTETARRLYVHRNTVHYRLRRIQRLTSLDLSRIEDRLLCEIGLIAERIAPP
jgi:PucR family transcriptional regulator, purine catabolism regulatory protein